MQYFKVEIIVANTFIDHLLDKMEQIDVKSYTALDISRGRGVKRGENLSEGLLPTTSNSLIFTVTTESQKDKMIQQLQPYLDERGGVLIAYPINYASGLTV